MDFGVNQSLVEEQFHRWTENPANVSESWRVYFARLHHGASQNGAYPDDAIPQGTSSGPSAAASFGAASAHANGRGNAGQAQALSLPATAEMPLSMDWEGQRAGSAASDSLREARELQGRVSALMNAYRVRGHLFADLDPLGLAKQPESEFALEKYGLAQVDPSTEFATLDMAAEDTLPLREIVRRLEETYCRTIGVEFHFLDDPAQRRFLQEQMEASCNHLDLSREEQVRIFTKLTDAEYFENFLHTNYLGAKRFSLEGAESFISLLDLCIERSAEEGVEEIVIGMAHRGRLNVFANILDMGFRNIFSAFEDNQPETKMGRGDVKYHLGHSADRTTQSGKSVHLTLCFNPSHLEFVNPVVEGRVRAKQDRRGDAVRRSVMPILVHGDAAFAGQGVVPETLNLERLEGYKTGGTIHVVINNQVGFTTSPEDGRSTHYCTDITRMLRCPVFHVNGEDPEAVAQVAKLASQFRARFQRDVVIDLYCYRKLGHNEADEPRFTQPVVYRAVDQKKTVGQAYFEKLTKAGKITEQEAHEIAEQRRARLEGALQEAREQNRAYEPASMHGLWSSYRGGPDKSVQDVPTAVPEDKLRALMAKLVVLPDAFSPNAKVKRLMAQRNERVQEGDGIDWGTAEWLAFASLLDEGTRIRLSGQDSRRGTFSHRHAVLYDTESGERHIPLGNIGAHQGSFEVYDSPLSEAGVLGFDYGYSLDSPDALVLWEAQFGDFVNGAQVIIDQFITSSEDKWHRLSGVVLLLPHGFEGQGPEHSSARLERFLASAAEDNIQVCNLTTAAQYFHCLRRQVLRPWRKPLVIMAPKSLLRSSLAASTLRDFSDATFERVIETPPLSDKKPVRRVLLCSGKVFYDLEAARREGKHEDVALVRMEQLYPLQEEALAALAKKYAEAEFVWVQEEPWNMGAWFFMQAHARHLFPSEFRCVSRPASASPATGSTQAHKLEQQHLLDQAFAVV